MRVLYAFYWIGHELVTVLACEADNEESNPTGEPDRLQTGPVWRTACF